MKRVHILRGLPGSGKSTLAKRIAREFEDTTDEYVPIHSTDSYFIGDDGVYRFNPSKLGEYHAKNFEAFCGSLVAGYRVIVVDNTNVQRWEFARYAQAADEHGYACVIEDVYDGKCTDEELAKRNTHGVPLASIKAMRARWEA